MKKGLGKFLLVWMFFACCHIAVYGQYSSEEETKEKASELFDQGDYTGAYAPYSHLLSLYVKDIEYNFRFGACELMAKNNKEKAIDHLELAVSNPDVDPRAYYFLARAYHLEYTFNQAISYYEKYKENAKTKDIKFFEVDQKIAMCESGKKLLQSITSINVVDKVEINRADFFRSYSLDDIGGKLIVKPDEFRTKKDVKEKYESVIHMGNNANTVYYSSYGAGDSQGGKDIYMVKRTGATSWGPPINLGPTINTPFDDDYPFLHPDGKTLYFSSKGHNSMGGYDIFKAELNPSTNLWKQPKNLDFAINTPDDDILYIVDKNNKLANFASTRSSQQGKITVYKVGVDPSPVHNTLIKGAILAEDSPVSKAAKITITNVADGKTAGIYHTNEDGEYFMRLPKGGGKYKMVVEPEGDAPIHTAQLDVPQSDVAKPLSQELRLVGSGSDQKMMVVNKFDEVADVNMADPMVINNLIKKQAELDVSSTDIVEGQDASDELVELSEAEDMSNEELISAITDMYQQVEKQSVEAEARANMAYGIAENKSNEVERYYGQAQELDNKSQAGTASNEEVIKSKELKVKSGKYAATLVAANDVARILDDEATERKNDLKQIEGLKSSVNSKANDREGLKAIYKEMKEKTEASRTSPTAYELKKSSSIDAIKKKEVDFYEVQQIYNGSKTSTAEIETEIADLEAKLSKAKKKDKEGIQAQLESLKIDLKDVKYEAEKSEPTYLNAKSQFEKEKLVHDEVMRILSAVETPNKSASLIEGPIKDRINSSVQDIESNDLIGFYVENKDEFGGEDLAASSDDIDGAIDMTSTDDFGDDLSFLDDEKEDSFDGGSESGKTDEAAIVSDYDLVSHHEDYGVVNEQGYIEDYSKEHGVEIANYYQIEEPLEKAALMAKVERDWVSDISEEMEIRQNQYHATEDPVTKDQLAEMLTVLAEEKSAKENELQKHLALLEASAPEVDYGDDNYQPIKISQENGDVMDYDTELRQELVAINKEEESLDKLYKRKQVHRKWEDALRQDLLLKQIEKENASADQQAAYESTLIDLNKNILKQKGLVKEFDERILIAKSQIALGKDPFADEEDLANLSEGDDSFDEFEFEDETGIDNGSSARTTNGGDSDLASNNGELGDLSEDSDSFDEFELDDETDINNGSSARTTKSGDNDLAFNNGELGDVSESDDSFDEFELEDETGIDNGASARTTNGGDNDLASNDGELGDLSEGDDSFGEFELEDETGVDNGLSARTTSGGDSDLASDEGELGDLSEDSDSFGEFEPEDESIEDNGVSSSKGMSDDLDEDDYGVLELDGEDNNGFDLEEGDRVLVKQDEEDIQLDDIEESLDGEFVSQEEDQNASSSKSLSNDLEDDDYGVLELDENYENDYEEGDETPLTESNEGIALKDISERESISESDIDEMSFDFEDDDIESSRGVNVSSETDELTFRRNGEGLDQAEGDEYIVDDEELVTLDEVSNDEIGGGFEDAADDEFNFIDIDDEVINGRGIKANDGTIQQEDELAFEEEVDNIDNRVIPEQNFDSNRATEFDEADAIVSASTFDISNFKGDISRIDDVPDILTEDIFVMDTGKPFYSGKGYPTMTRLPKGLVYKVQVGAFRNPISNDVFKGFAPIMKEPASEGITRYTAGMFLKMNNAKVARDLIRKIGYRDAFIVAFLDGKRVQIDVNGNLIDLLNGGPVADANLDIDDVDDDLSSNNEGEGGSGNHDVLDEFGIETDYEEGDGLDFEFGDESENNSDNDGGDESADEGKSDDDFIGNDEILFEGDNSNASGANSSSSNSSFNSSNNSYSDALPSGAYFTVQIGVFSQKKSDNFFNSPARIFTEELPGGVTKYYTGQFADINKAEEMKRTMSSRGVTDAFVVAYRNGSKVTVEDLMSSGESLTSGGTENTSYDNNSYSDDFGSFGGEEKTPKIEYKLRLGSYVGDVPIEDAELFLNSSDKGIQIEEQGNTTIYSISGLKTMDLAVTLKEEFKQAGIENPLIYIVKDGKDILIDNQ